MFLHINVIMIFFRAPTVKTAWAVLSGIFTQAWTWQPAFNVHLGMVVFLLLVHLIRGIYMSDRTQYVKMPGVVRGLFWFGLVLLVLYGSVDATERFIYFQF